MGTKQEKLGSSVMKWQLNEDGTFSGRVIFNGKGGELLHDDDEQRLLTRLKNEAGKLEPNYFGMDEAIVRFLKFMPGGFEGEQNLRQEREYKVRAHESLNAVLTAEQATAATDGDTARVRSAGIWINLLSPYESMHLKAALESSSGGAFLRAAAKFAGGEVNAGAQGMRQAMKAHGSLTWPIATYFPFLWDPEKHMFLKPTVTRDFAARVGDPFQYVYGSEITDEIYESLLKLAVTTRTRIAALNPRDNIDVQSFIWVVGAYTEADKPQPAQAKSAD